MGADDAPFMYSPVKHDARFPEKEFDPKAVTRASWEKPKTKKPKRDGPLVSFARHPDAHEVIGGRSSRFRPMSDRTKKAIKGVRRVQLCLRLLQVLGALGILVLMILISNVAPLTAWVMRITAGVVAVHCVYSIVHHSRPARARTPASSAAYQLFSAAFDLATMSLYAFGAMAVRNHSDDWKTLIDNTQILRDYFIPALYYTLISADGIHLLSLAIGLYLGLVFRRITQMPPDMNPLEDHLTARISSRHKRNKSSIATYSTVSNSDSRLSTPLEAKRRSGAPYEDVNRPPSIPFIHTRTSSSDSKSSKRDSRLNLPSRRYQIQPANSPRNSTVDLSLGEYVPSARASMVSQNENFVTYPSISRAGTASLSSPPRDEPRYANGYGTEGEESKRSSAGSSGTPRQPKFTEAWYTSDSLLDRTAKRAAKQRDSKTYAALTQRYDFDDNDHSSSEDSDAENQRPGRLSKNGPGGKGAYTNLDRHDTVYRSGYYAEDVDLSTGEIRTPPPKAQPTTPKSRPQTPSRPHPNPLREHPTTSDLDISDHPSDRDFSTSNYSDVSALTEVDPNNRRVSGCDIADVSVARPKSEYVPQSRGLGLSLTEQIHINARANGNTRINTRESASKTSSPKKPATPSRPFSVADPITGPGAVTGRLSPYTTNTLTPPKARNGGGNSSAPNSPSSPSGLSRTLKKTPNRTPTKFAPKNRNSSIQPEEGLFVAKSYGELREATPPIMVGSNRQVSSGNDYHTPEGGDLGARESSSRYVGASGGSIFGRRNVSGKVAEEGRARWSRFSRLNDD